MTTVNSQLEVVDLKNSRLTRSVREPFKKGELLKLFPVRLLERTYGVFAPYRASSEPSLVERAQVMHKVIFLD